MPYFDINYFAIILAVVASIGIGMIWYSPVLFGKMWAQLSGKELSELKSPVFSYGATIIAAFVTAFFLSQLMYFFGADTVRSAVKIAIWSWLGFSAASSVSDYVFAGRSRKLFLINTGLNLITFIAMAIIIVLFR